MPTVRIIVDGLSCRVHPPSRLARATMGDRLRFLRSLDAAACRAKGGAPPVNCAARRSLFARADRIRARLLPRIEAELLRHQAAESQAVAMVGMSA